MYRDMEEIFRTFFFKKRLVFALSDDEYKAKEVNDKRYKVVCYRHDKDIEIESILTHLNPLVQEYNRGRKIKLRKLTKTKLCKRLKNDNCGLHIIEDKKSASPVAFGWYLVNKEKKILFHDKFPLSQENSLAFNDYVHPDHRGIFILLQAARANHLLEMKKIKKIYAVIEKSNKPSIIANKAFGFKKVAENYLIKLFGWNLVSIIKQNNSKDIYQTIRREYCP